jgi:hypothetical protein
VAAQLAAYQERLSSMQLVSYTLTSFNRFCMKMLDSTDYYLRHSCRQARNFRTSAAYGLRELTQTESSLQPRSVCGYLLAVLYVVCSDFRFA